MKLRIKELRLQRGLTVAELADRSGLSPSYLSELENNKKPINATRLAQVADALHVYVHDLLSTPEMTSDMRRLLQLALTLQPEAQAALLEFAELRAQKASPQTK